MVDVKRNIDGTLTFSYDGFTLPYVFVKVEQVAENSNYYCLWITEEEFHLFNIRTKEYALKINTYKESKIFSKIEFYSKDTRSFVAYRSDKEYAYLLFEDGEYENYVFKYVGKELNGIRAVKGHNNKWMYYNVLKKEFTFNINKGLLLRDDEELVPLFNLRYYTVYKVDLYYRLIFFDIQKRKTYYSDKIEYFEDSEDNRVIGKLFNRNVYALFKRTNLITPIGYFNSKPRYVYARNIFIAKKLNFYVIIDGNKEISNCQWTEDCFIFHNNYILNKSKGGIWKLYNFNDGKEICTNWTNIRYDSELCCIVADTDNQKNKKIAESDIEGLSNLLLEKSKKCLEYTEPNIAQQKVCRSNTDVGIVKPQNEDKEVALNTSQYNELPPRIDFLAFVEHITISQDGYIISDRARKTLSVNDNICWIIQNKHAVAITRFLNTKAHKIIFYKEDVDLNIFDKSSQTKSFIRTNIRITNGEESLFKELSYEYDLNSDITLVEKPIVNYLPVAVNYCVFVDELNINSYGKFEYKTSCKHISPKVFICWNIKKEQTLLISKYLGNNQHRIVFLKRNNIGLLYPTKICNQFIEKRITISTEAVLIRKINKIVREEALTTSVPTSNTISEGGIYIPEKVKDKTSTSNTSTISLKKQMLPSGIDICVFVKKIDILEGIYVREETIHEGVCPNSNVCWIVCKEKQIVIAKYIGYFQAINAYLYKILYHIKDCEDDLQIDNEFEYIYTTPFCVYSKESLINRLKEIAFDENENIKRKMSAIKEMNEKKEIPLICVPYHNDEPSSKNVTEFYFDNIAYSLKVNDVWSKPDIFARRQFVLKQNIVAILLDSTSEKFVKDNITYYEIIGEGKDKRFDQDFGPTNSSIRDNYRRIILFRKGSNGDIIFEDEVICVGFRIIPAEECDKKSRKIIVFQLRSLLRDTPCKNQQLKTENEVSIDDVATDISIVKNENVLDTDSIDDESNDKTNELLLNDGYNKIINEDHSMNNLDDKKTLLQKLYQTMTTLKELGLKINNDLIAEIERLEGDIITNELVPIISNKISDVLSPIKRNVTLIVDYEPNKPISIKISRNSNNVTVIKNEQQKEQINVEGIETHSKSARSNLRITLPNGRIIKHSTAVESLIEFILYVGIEKVEKIGLVRCKVPLISQNIDRKYSDRQKFIGNRRYLMTCTSTLAKKEDIEEIARYYNLNVKVEII